MRKKRERRRPMSFRSIAVRVISLTAALWLCLAGLLTWAVAENFYSQLESITLSSASSAADAVQLLEDGNYDEIGMIEELRLPYRHRLDALLPIVGDPYPSHSSDDWIYRKWNLLYGYEAAVAFYDADRTPLIQCGNYLIFEYTTESNWKSENVESMGEFYLNLDEIEGGVEALGVHTYDIQDWGYFFPFQHLYRLHGYFEGQQFHPTLIEGETRISYDSSLKYINFLDNHRYNQLEWETILTLEADPEQETQILYAWNIDGLCCDHEPVTANGTTFDSLAELLHADFNRLYDYERKSLLDSIIIFRIAGEKGIGAVAIRCWPLGYAAFRLIPFYLISLTVVALALWLILWQIYKNLTSPLLDLATSTATGRTITPSANWWEPYQLEKYLSDTRQALTDTNTQLTQTQTALEYAHHAEENRKKLVSDLAHELKTPLAIIHSYAEGLQEGIAEDKKEQYLSVILEQSERMDALVLQMLDLSRLEAGKVRLAVEPVDLLKLTKAITDRFAPLLEEKDLTLRYDMAEDLTIPADEARMEQVITNLVSNAAKYTPPEGTIWVNVYSFNEKAHFFIGNTAPHLSDEALEKVWDSFYRADPSRTEPGTGLGLALVKGIISLHRGECSVRNTTDENGASAVEFGFTLPIN